MEQTTLIECPHCGIWQVEKCECTSVVEGEVVVPPDLEQGALNFLNKFG